MKLKKVKTSQIVILILALIFCGLMMFLIGRPLTQFVSEPEKFQAWVADKGIWGVLAFIGMNIVQVFLAIIPGGPFEVGAGYAFGIVKGTLICDFAMTLASVIIFLFVRKFGMKFVEIFMEKEDIESLKFLKTSEKSTALLFLFFLIPGTPKDLMCYAVGLTDLKLWVWIVINFVGRFPAILLSAMSGSALNSQRYEIFIIMFAVIAVFYVIGLFVYKKHNK